MKHPRFFLLLVIFLASVLRLFQLGVNPPALDWDEVSLGYNAYSILKTGSDEFGNFLPVSIRSFNDYKPPLYTYLSVPSIALFGLTEFGVRLPSALAGILAVAALYFLTKEIFTASKHKNSIGITASLLLAVSPWHLQFSRAAFEANLALTLYIISIYFFIKWLNSKTPKLTFLLISAAFSALTLYSYHSARLILPIFFLAAAVLFRQKLFKFKAQTGTSILLALLLVSPLLIVLLKGTGTQRFNTVSFLKNPGLFSRETERINRISKFESQHSDPLSLLHHPVTALSKITVRNYLEHFNLDFLFLTGDGNGRHAASGMGLLYLVELPLLLFGIYKLVGNKHKNIKIIWIWLLAGPTAASLTTDTPHAVRSLLMLPSFQIITAYGIISLIHIKFKFKKTLLIVSGFLFFVNVFYYLNLYYVITPFKQSQDWQYGYKQLVERTSQIESDYNQIVITNKWDQPHIFFAFYNQIDPAIYQAFAETAYQGFGKYTFKQIDFNQDIQTPNTLIIADPEHSPTDQTPFYQIKFLSGEPAFNFYQSSM